METSKVFIFGASGHAKVVIDIIEKQGLHRVAFLVDDDPTLKDTEVYGYKVVGGKTDLFRENGFTKGFVAIGNNSARKKVAEWLTSNGFQLITAIHPSAQIARGAYIGNGTVVMACSVINSDARIGNNVIINTGATVDHDCIIEDYVHVAPGATLCGNVKVGLGTFICAGSKIIPNVTIGANALVGAGATVIGDIPSNVTAVGTPARLIRSKEQS